MTPGPRLPPARTPFVATVRHEWRSLRRDRAFVWLLATFAALCAYGAWNGHARAAERERSLEAIAEAEAAARAATRARWELAEAQNPELRLPPSMIAAGVWHQPALPSLPLAPLAAGRSEA